MPPFTTFRATLACGVLACVFSGAALAAKPAARVVYAFGQVQAVDEQGGRRALERGAAVYPGDTVQTVAGRTQIRFTDGGFAALQPNTRYKVEDYLYEGAADGKERGFFNLLKGTVRLVTGVIGHANRSNFRLSTKVATIGIRGTAGVIQTCNGDCAGKEDGTYLSGYGGVWDLQSGNYSGPVASGESYHCDGADCQKLEGPSGNRAEVGDDEALTEKKKEEEETPGVQENVVAQGNQVDAEGVQCDLGGGCGDFLVLSDQLGAAVSDGQSGAGDFDVILLGGRPIASIGSSEFDDGLTSFRVTEIDTTSVDQIRALVNDIDDGFREERLALLAQVDPALESLLNANPAEVADEDFGTTPDGVLTYGRFVDGSLLNFRYAEFIDSSGNTASSFDTSLQTLSGLQSWHFIYGSEPGPIASAAVASYVFAGGSFSSTFAGASLGKGVTAGRLDWDFLLGTGALSMTVNHAGVDWLVDGDLRADSDSRSFTDFSVQASGGGLATTATIAGFFAGPSKGGAPVAAGLSYLIKDSDPIIGVAGFRLDSVSESAGLTALPTGSRVLIAENTSDSGAPNVMNGVASAVAIDGVTAGGVTQSGVLRGLSSSVFAADATAATLVESGSVASLGVSWARLRDPLVTVHPGLVASTTRVGDLHVAYTTQPTLSLPTTGSFTYGTLLGGTAPTLNRAFDGTTYTGSHSVSVDVDFTAGVLFNFAVSGSVPSAGASYSMSTANTESIVAGQPTTFTIIAGDPGDVGSFTSPICSSCTVNGTAQLIFTGAAANALVGSYGVTSNNVSNGEAVTGSFVIGP